MFFRATILALTLLITAADVQAQANKPTIIETDLESNFDLRCNFKRNNANAKKPPLAGVPSLLLGYKSGQSQLNLNFTADALQLTRKLNGKTIILASVRQFYTLPAKQEIPIVVQWRNGSLRVIYDQRTILRREGLGPLKAETALAATKGDYEFAEASCQPIEPVAFADDFMRAAGDAGQWKAQTGEWKIHSATDPAKVANAFTYVGQGKPAIAVAGNWFWDDYRMGIAVRPSGHSTIGLVVYWQDAQNYILFRWLPEDDNSARGREKQLWRVWRGQPALLAAAPGGCRAKQWYHLAINVGSGTITVGVDGQRVLQKRTDLFGQGKVGLYSSGDQPVLIDDVMVEHAPTFDRSKIARSEAITPQFTKEQSMESWASPKAEWLPVKNAPDALAWHRGTFFGNHALEFKVSVIEPDRAKVSAVLCADGKSPNSGYELVITQAANKQRVQAALTRLGKAVVQPVSVPIGGAACAVRFERAGQTMGAYIDGKLVASYADAKPLNGRRAGCAAQGAQVALGEARVSGSNVYDYTFYRAPTDWYVSGGTWDMTSRWDCSPNWSWYGGWSERVAAIWNKHSFGGDFVIDLFAACRREAGTYHARDINISVGGDGRDLSSGYSFIFGGWNNTSTRILRGNKTVAETTKFILPKDYQAQAHHKWFNLRVERTGNQFSLYVDRELALQWTDSDPLAGRRLALWTCGNGVIIARATIYYQKELAVEPVPLLIENRDWNLLPVEKLGWTARGKDASLRLDAVAAPTPPAARSATARRYLSRVPVALVPIVRALNMEGGGQFAIVPELDAFDALKTPHLSFDYRLEKGAAVNLYLRVQGDSYSIRLNGPTKEMELEGTKVLSGVKDVRADNQWHRVALDLAALLKPLYPNDKEIRVEEVFLGNLSRDSYQQAGFSANPPGATYFVRSFALRGTDKRIAKTVEPKVKTAGKPILLATAPPILPRIAAEPAAEPPVTTQPVAIARGLHNLRVTYCQDADGGDFKPETLNQPISWNCFKKPIATTTVDRVEFDWADKSPHPGIRSKYWSARFFGKLMVPKQGDYTFVLDRLDDGGRLYIDGQLVIDSWRIQAATSQESKPITLSPGAHDIRLDYSQGSGLGSLALRWSGPDFGREVISKAEQPAVTLAKLAAN